MDDSVLPISEREIQVLQLVATGASNQEIARDLVISVNTVKVHLRNIFEKLGVQSRTEATLYAIRQGWVAVDSTETAAPEHPGEASAVPVESSILLAPLAWWQRLYALAAVLLALGLLFLPVFWQEDRAAAMPSPMSDLPVASSGSLRADTSRWMPQAGLPTPRTWLALAAHNGQLFAIWWRPGDWCDWPGGDLLP